MRFLIKTTRKRQGRQYGIRECKRNEHAIAATSTLSYYYYYTLSFFIASVKRSWKQRYFIFSTPSL